MVKASINSLCPCPLACIRWFPPPHFPFLVKILSHQSIFLKVVSVSTKSRSFPPSQNHTLYTLLTVGPTPLHSWDAKGQNLDLTLFTCLATLVFLLFWFISPVFFAAFALFYRALCSFFLHIFPAVVALFLLFFPSYLSCCCCFVSYYVCHFLWFGISLIHVVPAADTFYYSLFLRIVFLHIRFNSYPFIQKDFGLCGPNNLYWIKRDLGPNLP